MRRHNIVLPEALVFDYCNTLDVNKQTECPDISDSEEVCLELATKEVEQYDGDPVKFSGRRVKNIFLGSLESLGKDTYSFYRSELPRVGIKKREKFPNNQRILPGAAAIFRRDDTGVVYVQKDDHTTRDVTAVFHELGHLPLIVNGANGDYFEYQEVLPMFMESLGCKTLDEAHAKEMFEKINLGVAIGQSKDYKYYLEHNTSEQQAARRLNEINRRSCFSYVKSLEYVLQLLDRHEDDSKMVNYAIDKVVNGESTFKDMESFLEIDTRGCKKILSRF